MRSNGEHHGGANSLALRLLNRIGIDITTVDLALEDLEQLLSEQISSAETNCPGVRVPRARFIDFLAPCLDENEPLTSAIERLPIHDLWLACACLDGDDAAVRALHDIVQEVARTAVAGVGVDQAVREDIGQDFGVRLLFGTPSTPPLIARYNGLAPLRSWLRLMMVRSAVHLKKRNERHRPYEDQMIEGLALDTADPELSYLKAHYVQEFRAAFKEALLELDAKEQNTLRYLVVEGLRVQEIANFFGVNRVTVSKRLRAIRQRLLKRTRYKLSLTLQADPEQLDSIIRMIQTRLDITVNCLTEQ